MADRQTSPYAEALGWVAKITTIGCEMVAPGLVGSWLEHRYGLRFLAIAGFVLGFFVGFWHLMVMVRTPRS